MRHGYSTKPDDRPYEVAQYVEQVLAVLDALKVGRACLVGTSLGGWISARIAASAPERVDTLSLVSSGGLTSYAHVMNSLRDLGTRAAADDRAAVRKRLEYVIHDPAKVTDELVDLRAAIYGQADYQRVLPRIFCLQDPETRARNLLTVEELGRVRAPTIVVWTRHDPTATVEDGRRYADAIPGARFEVLEDSSHMPQLEETEKFDALHLAFLEGAAARAVAE
jgi:2-hydroxy-6-oxonona-2,4-dienedioate hydrolase